MCVSQLQILLCLHHKPLVKLAVNDLAIAVNFEIVPLIHNFVSGPVVKYQFYQYYHITDPTHHTITCDMWISHVPAYALLSSSYTVVTVMWTQHNALECSLSIKYYHYSHNHTQASNSTV